jgi:hypothetical protein
MYEQQKAAVPNNQMAVISAVLAAVAWVVGLLGSCILFFVFPVATFCTGAVFLITSLAAVITGYMARSQIKNSAGAEGGEGLAMFGLIGGAVALVLAVLGLCLIPVATIAGLSLLGPDVGNVFSEIIRELETPIP